MRKRNHIMNDHHQIRLKTRAKKKREDQARKSRKQPPKAAWEEIGLRPLPPMEGSLESATGDLGEGIHGRGGGGPSQIPRYHLVAKCDGG